MEEQRSGSSVDFDEIFDYRRKQKFNFWKIIKICIGATLLLGPIIEIILERVSQDKALTKMAEMAETQGDTYLKELQSMPGRTELNGILKILKALVDARKGRKEKGEEAEVKAKFLPEKKEDLEREREFIPDSNKEIRLLKQILDLVRKPAETKAVDREGTESSVHVTRSCYLNALGIEEC